MMTAVLLLLTTGLIWGVVGVLFGRAPQDKNKLCSWFALNAVVFTSFVLLTQTPAPAPGREILRLSYYIVPSAFLEIAAFLLLKLAMNRGSQGIAWCVMQSAMIVPFLGSLLLLNNTASLWQWLGITLIIGSLVAFGITKHSAGGSRQSDSTFFRYVFTAFALVGAAHFLRVIPGSAGFSAETLSWRLLLQTPCGLLFWFGACCKNRSFQPRAIWKQSLLYGTVTALGQTAFYISTDAADRIKLTSIIYPISLGTCIAFFSLYCFFIRKEQVSKLSWVATAATIAGIAFMAVR